jgi:NAD(P)-dependent dehydrogenase (short-subunit alcohol dehydrogenase family)
MPNFVTVVTGAAGGFGSELVTHLVAQGQRVAAVDRPESAARLQELAARNSDAVVALPLDVSSARDWLPALERIERELGAAPQGAVLAAGGWQGGVEFHAPDSDRIFRAMLEINLETARVALGVILSGMVARQRGSIVLFGSRAVERPWESAGAAAYAAAKSAVVALCRAVAAEVVTSGVRVNAVLPSTIDTPANRRAMPGADPSRWVAPRSLAGVVEFLLSDAARDVSGAALPVYGRS